MSEGQVPQCANPLYLEWLGQWMEFALENNQRSYYSYKRAYESMAKYPAPFTHPVEALCLSGVGPRIVEQLEQRLEQYCRDNGLPMPSARGKRPADNQIGRYGAPAPAATGPKRPRKERPYIPTRRSGAYGILLALLDSKDQGEGSMTQHEICSVGQKYCDTSYTVPDHGKFYTAWNSIKTLLEKGLVYKSGSAYMLTGEGDELARRMRVVEREGGLMASTPSSTDSSASARTASSGLNTYTSSSARSYSVHSTPRESDLIPTSSYRISESSSTSRVWTSSVTSSSRYEVSLLDDDDDEPVLGGSVLPATTGDTFKAPTPPIARPSSQSSSKLKINTTEDLNNIRSSIDRVNSKSSLARYGSSGSRSNSQMNSLMTYPDTFPRLRDPDYVENNNDSPNSESTAFSYETLKHLAEFEPLVCKRGQFEIFLVLDNREVRSREDRDYIEQKLQGLGVPVLKRPLEIGDYAWIARPTVMHTMDMPEEIVLDYICERKRMDDLVSSIKHTRFHEQKFRLSRSGIGQVIYLVETYKANEVYDIGDDAIQSALAGCQVVDGFFVKRCQTMDQTIDYLASVTKNIQKLYQNKDIYIIPDNRIDRQNFLALKEVLRQKEPSRIYHTSYTAFRRLNSKSDSVSVKDTFSKILMTIRGVSAEKAVEIVRTFKTPRALFSALDYAEDDTFDTSSGSAASSRATSVDSRIGNKRKKVIAQAGPKVGRKKIGPALSEKIATFWYAEEYDTFTYTEQ
ncbi:Crossover junction endonuclease mus81 [Actinomortierella wolfii]|nr:Crossover junction endonuclease mus81 [Actinomortierella wolfii]